LEQKKYFLILILVDLISQFMDILGLIRRLPEIVAYNKFDDDFFDRLNYSHTVAILTIFAIIVTNRQFSENQIKCWVCII